MSDPKITDLEEIAQTDARGAWLLTYADLITLLLVFFVLLFSLSTMSMKKVKETLKSYEIAFEKETGNATLFDVIDTSSIDEKKMLDQLIGMREIDIFRDINSLVYDKKLSGAVQQEFRDGKIFLRVAGSILFSSGSARLSPGSDYILDDISKILKNYPHYKIDIQGHTDNLPIVTSEFASNWELSAVRATTVLRYLIERGISEERMTATGFADLKPIASNDTVEGRTLNRRVEFVLKKE